LRGRAEELAATAPTATDTVAKALVAALEAAEAAGNWSEVAELARALDAHQRAVKSVVNLDSVRAKKRGRR